MNSKTLPHADHFVPVEPTKESVEFANLRTVDLSTYNHGHEAREKLAQEVLLAMTTQGFFYLVNHGLSEENINRQVDIGHHILKNTPPEEKHRLQARMVDEGSYHGFKPRGHWEWTKGVPDRIENYNTFRDLSTREHPAAMKPFKPEIQDFIDHTHKDILFKLLRLFAIALKIEDEDFFVKLHDYDRHDETWLRWMKYYDDYTKEEREASKGVWLGGHQDFTALSILFSQPMSSLQVRDYESSEWKYVKHIPGACIVNAGEVMLWWTGDYFKAAIHRVVEPPVDQRGRERCGVFYFAVPNDDVVINTLLDASPVLRKAGVQMAHEPGKAPTSKEWCNGRVKITGRGAKWAGKGDEANVVAEKVGNVTTRWFR